MTEIQELRAKAVELSMLFSQSLSEKMREQIFIEKMSVDESGNAKKTIFDINRIFDIADTILKYIEKSE
jgi:hypothetical protein